MRLFRQESYVLDAELLDLWQAHSGLERQEILTAIDDLALADRVSIQVGRYGEREIGLTDPMREFKAAGCDIGQVLA